MAESPTFSVCIPAYNRPELLGPLLDSILAQEYDDFEIVICEDDSRDRELIRSVVASYQKMRPGLIRYFENETNLGYDGNLRSLIDHSSGRYCWFMGNDDLMCPGALSYVGDALKRHEGVGVVLRSYAAFEGEPANIVRTTRYFNEERLFPAGEPTVVTFFRRSIVISGMVLHRESARSHATAEFDGTTLYQQHLVAKILMTYAGLFLPGVVVLYRDGGVPEFGGSPSERGKFIPGKITPESSLTFMKGMLSIARHIDASGDSVFLSIRRDVANYSYPIIVLHRDKGMTVFLRYVYGLAHLGLWRSPWFFVYVVLLALLGTQRVERLAQWVKNKAGHTPVLGSIYRGEAG